MNKNEIFTAFIIHNYAHQHLENKKITQQE